MADAPPPPVGPWKIQNVKPLNNWLERIGHVSQIMHMPCSPTPEIWIRAVWSGTPYIIWTLFKPDAFDQVTERFGRGHHRTRRFKGTGVDAITSEIPVPSGNGWARFANLGFLAERLGWYMLIADAATRAAVRWSSLAMQYAGCNDPNLPRASATATEEIYETPPGGTLEYAKWEPEARSLLSIREEGIVQVAVSNLKVSVHVEFHSPFFNPEWRVGSVDVVNVKGKTLSKDHKLLYSGSGTTATCDFTVEDVPFDDAMGLVSLRLTNTDGLFTMTSATFDLFAYNSKGEEVGHGFLQHDATIHFPDQPDITLAQWIELGVVGEIKTSEKGFIFAGGWGLRGMCRLQAEDMKLGRPTSVETLEVYDEITGRLIASAPFENFDEGAKWEARAVWDGIGIFADVMLLNTRLTGVEGDLRVIEGSLNVTLSGDKGIIADP